MPTDVPARVVDVVDGDTLDVVARLPLDTRRFVTVRLEGVDTAEVHGVDDDSEEFDRGSEHSAFVREWVDDAEDVDDWPLVLGLVEKGKYGRWIARVRRRSDGEDLTARLLEEFPRLQS